MATLVTSPGASPTARTASPVRSPGPPPRILKEKDLYDAGTPTGLGGPETKCWNSDIAHLMSNGEPCPMKHQFKSRREQVDYNHRKTKPWYTPAPKDGEAGAFAKFPEFASVKEEKTKPEVLMAMAKAKIEGSLPGLHLGPKADGFSPFPKYEAELEYVMSPVERMKRAKEKLKTLLPGMKGIGGTVPSPFPEVSSCLEVRTPREVKIKRAKDKIAHTHKGVKGIKTLDQFSPFPKFMSVVDAKEDPKLIMKRAKEKIEHCPIGMRSGGTVESKFPEYMSVAERIASGAEKMARAQAKIDAASFPLKIGPGSTSIFTPQYPSRMVRNGFVKSASSPML